MFFIKVFINWIKTKIIKCNNVAIIWTNSEDKFHFLIAWMQEKARFFIPLYKFFSNLHEMAFHLLTTHCSRSISVSGCLARLRMRLFIIAQTFSSGFKSGLRGGQFNETTDLSAFHATTLAARWIGALSSMNIKLNEAESWMLACSSTSM